MIPRARANPFIHGHRKREWLRGQHRTHRRVIRFDHRLQRWGRIGGSERHGNRRTVTLCIHHPYHQVLVFFRLAYKVLGHLHHGTMRGTPKPRIATPDYPKRALGLAMFGEPAPPGTPLGASIGTR